MRKISVVLLAVFALVLSSCNDKYPDLKDGMYAEITTNKGTAIAELFYKEVPLTVANFVSLAEGTNTMVDSTYKGKKFYDGIIFHRVIKDFMIQTGDPLGTGQGDPGYKFPDEFVDSLSHKGKGILSMANSGPATNGSQFFITLKETPWLDQRHTVFGEIVKGQDVIDSIGVTVTEQGDRPKDEIKMQTVTIIRKGGDAKSFDAPKIFTEELTRIEEESANKKRLEEEAKTKRASDFAAKKETAKKMDSGLAMLMLEEGEGPKPKTGQKVGTYYIGYLADGTVFDTNMEAKAKELGIFDERRKAGGGYGALPADYSNDAPMIPGFKEGLQQMKVGDKALLFIPSHLGYGKNGGGRVIPPDSDLVFELHLDSIMPAEEPAAK